MRKVVSVVGSCQTQELATMTKTNVESVTAATTSWLKASCFAKEMTVIQSTLKNSLGIHVESFPFFPNLEISEVGWVNCRNILVQVFGVGSV